MKTLPKLTGRGFAWLAAGAAALLVGLLTADAVLTQFALCGIFLLLLAIPVSILNLRCVTYDHVFPEAVFSGLEFEVAMMVRNGKRVLGAFDVEVREEIMDLKSLGPVHLSMVSSGQTGIVSVPTRLGRRGVFEKATHTIRSQFPLGLTWNEKTGLSPCRLVVYPAPLLPVSALELLESGSSYGRFRNLAAAEVTGEFRSTREYQPGDNAKLISWPISVRFQELVVKEMEQPGPQKVVVIFHSYCPERHVMTPNSFEKALRHLAGLFAFLQEQMIPFDFIAQFNAWERMPVHVEESSSRRVLESLAMAAMTVSNELNTLRMIVQREARAAVSLVIVSNTSAKHWAHLLPELAVPVLCVDNLESGMAMHSAELPRTSTGRP